MAKKKNIEVQGLIIRIEPINEKDYVNLTDIAKSVSDEKPAYTIQNWIRNNNTIRYLSKWETVHNENLKVVHLHDLLERFTNNRAAVSAGKWIEETGAIGLVQKKGRGGGTYAHADIALNFMYWLSPEFQIYFIKEFQRLKTREALGQGERWTVRREISKANYPLVTQAVKEYLIPEKLPKNQRGIVYASEVDVINVALFGITAKEWKIANPNAKVNDNIRDDKKHTSILDLTILGNLEVMNSNLIEWGCDQAQRLELLTKAAEKQREILSNNAAIKRLEQK